jgi:hypothetical protein
MRHVRQLERSIHSCQIPLCHTAEVRSQVPQGQKLARTGPSQPECLTQTRGGSQLGLRLTRSTSKNGDLFHNVCKHHRHLSCIPTAELLKSDIQG